MTTTSNKDSGCCEKCLPHTKLKDCYNPQCSCHSKHIRRSGYAVKVKDYIGGSPIIEVASNDMVEEAVQEFWEVIRPDAYGTFHLAKSEQTKIGKFLRTKLNDIISRTREEARAHLNKQEFLSLGEAELRGKEQGAKDMKERILEEFKKLKSYVAMYPEDFAGIVESLSDNTK